MSSVYSMLLPSSPMSQVSLASAVSQGTFLVVSTVERNDATETIRHDEEENMLTTEVEVSISEQEGNSKSGILKKTEAKYKKTEIPILNPTKTTPLVVTALAKPAEQKVVRPSNLKITPSHVRRSKSRTPRNKPLTPARALQQRNQILQGSLSTNSSIISNGLIKSSNKRRGKKKIANEERYNKGIITPKSDVKYNAGKDEDGEEKTSLKKNEDEANDKVNENNEGINNRDNKAHEGNGDPVNKNTSVLVDADKRSKEEDPEEKTSFRKNEDEDNDKVNENNKGINNRENNAHEGNTNPVNKNMSLLVEADTRSSFQSAKAVFDREIDTIVKHTSFFFEKDDRVLPSKNMGKSYKDVEVVFDGKFDTIIKKRSFFVKK